MKNRKLLLIVSVVLALTMSLGGTLAYLTDTDADVNTMVLGNVSIEQHEYERVLKDDGTYETIQVTKADGTTQQSYKLQPYTQDKPLLPAVGNPNGGYTDTYVRFEQLDDPKKVQGGQLFLKDIKNAQDKIVLVENTGNSDAYVRTYFAFEKGTLEDTKWNTLVGPGICKGNDGEPWEYTSIGDVTINGNKYYVMEAVYTGYSTGNNRHKDGILPGGEWTYNSLSEIYLASDATNEDLEALDGNKNGTYDIIVLSQAVQADGFEATTDKSAAQVALEAGFGAHNAINEVETTKTNLQVWLEGASTTLPKVATSVADVTADLTAGKSEVVLGEGNFTVPSAVAGKTVTFKGSGEETVMNMGTVNNVNGASITFENMTITGKNSNENYGFGIQHTTGDIVYKNCTFVNAITNEYTGNVTYEDCTFTGTYYICTYSVQNATFKNCVFDRTDSRAILVFSHGNNPVNVLVEDCTFKAEAKGYTGSGAWTAAVEVDTTNISSTGTTVTINNCTYDSNYNGIVRDKSTANKNAVITVNGQFYIQE